MVPLIINGRLMENGSLCLIAQEIIIHMMISESLVPLVDSL
jgi:hypothetical protein